MISTIILGNGSDFHAHNIEIDLIRQEESTSRYEFEIGNRLSSDKLQIKEHKVESYLLWLPSPFLAPN